MDTKKVLAYDTTPPCFLPFYNKTYECEMNKKVNILKLGDGISSFTVDRDIDFLSFFTDDLTIISFDLIKDKKYVLGKHYLMSSIRYYVISSTNVVLTITYSNYNREK